MANSLDAYIPELWANESVSILVENMVIANLVHTDFRNEIASFGDIVHTRKPAEFTAKRKTNADPVTVQDASATDILVPLDQHFHTTFLIKDGEESKSFKQLSAEYLFPAVKSIATAIDQVLLGEVHRFYVNAEGIATGLTTDNIIKYIVETRKRMNINKAHMDNRHLILTPDTEAIALQTSAFHEADKVGDEGTAMREASLGRKFGFNTYMSQNSSSTIGMPTLAGAALIDNANGYPIGTTVVHVDTGGSNIEVGNWLTIGGVQHQVTALGTLATEDQDITINPPLRVAVAQDDVITHGDLGLVNEGDDYAAGYAKELVVDAIVGIIPVGALVSFATPGTPSVIMPAIYSVIDSTDTAGNTTGITLNKPLAEIIEDGDEISFGAPANHNFAFHRNALTLVSRPLAAAPAGLALSSVQSMGGVGIRVTITYDGNLQGVRVTVDLLCGVQVLDLALGAVLIG